MRLRRDRPLTLVTAAWQVAPDALREALEQDLVPAAVGPAEQGWSVARLLLDADAVLEPRGRAVVDLVDDLARSLRAPGIACLAGESGGRLLLAGAGGGLPAGAEVPALGSGDAPVRADWAEVLRVLGRLDALQEVLDAADGGPRRSPPVAELSADRRALDVAGLLGLPGVLVDLDVLDDETPYREAVVSREVTAAEVGLAAALVGGPLLLAEDDSTAAVVAAEPDGVPMLPGAIQLAPLRRTALVLWRRGRSRGLVQVRFSQVQQAHTWSDAWEVVRLDPTLDDEGRAGLQEALLPPQADAALLAERLGGPDTDLVALRTVLRRAPDADCLADLCVALGLDPAAARVVEASGPAELPGARAVAPAAGASALWDAAAAPRAGDPWWISMGHRKPWWYRLADVAFAVLAVLGAVALWDRGGGLARTGAVLLVLLALASVVDAVTPGYGTRASRL